MTDYTDDPLFEGQRRAAAWRAKMEASSAAMTEASMKWHKSDSEIVNRGQAGLFGRMTATDMGAAVAARQVRIGQDYGGGGRALERQGGTFDHANDGPAPARADLRNVGMPPGHQIGESPLAAYMRTRGQ